MTVRAVIYARLSVAKKSGGPDQEQSDSIENQVANGVRVAADMGYDLVDTYIDDGRSAFKGVARPGYSQMLSNLVRERFDIVLVRHHDRLNRNEDEAYKWRVACQQHGVRWQTFAGTITDPSTAEGSFNSKVFSAFAELESQIKRERLLMKNAQRRVDGELLPQGFGWGRGGKKIVEEAEHVAWMFERLAGGASLGAIVRRMNDLEVPQKRTGTKWAHGTVVSILRNPRVAGLVPGEDGQILAGVEGKWDALIEPELFHAAQAAWHARRPEKGPTNNFSTRYLLGGIAECGVCGLPLRSNGNAENAPGRPSSGTYRCTYNRHSAKDGRRHVSARVDVLDELTRRAIASAFMLGPRSLLPSADDDVRDELNRVHQQLAQLDVKKADLLSSTTDPDLGVTMRDIAPGLRSIQERAAQLDSEREALRQSSAAASMLSDLRIGLFDPGERVSLDAAAELHEQLLERLKAMDIESQRDLVRHFLTVRVLPGRGTQRYKILHKVVPSLNDDDQLSAHPAMY